MRRFRLSALAAALVATPLAAVAADYPQTYVPPPVAIGHQWYLKGYIGMAAQHLKGGLDNALFDTTDIVEFLDPGHFDATPLFGIGIGYRHSERVRFDLTGEYRGKAAFSALDRYETVDDLDPATFDGTNQYTAKKSEWLLLVNGYYDIGTWRGVTPYVGAGVGASLNTIYDFTDTDVTNAAVAFGATASRWNLAWALHAGLGMQVTDNMTVDLGYSFVNLGSAQSGDLIAFDGSNPTDNPMIFNNLVSHDFKLGVRWAFDHNVVPNYPPMVKY